MKAAPHKGQSSMEKLSQSRVRTHPRRGTGRCGSRASSGEERIYIKEDGSGKERLITHKGIDQIRKYNKANGSQLSQCQRRGYIYRKGDNQNKP